MSDETNLFREQASAIVAAVLSEKPADAAKAFGAAVSDVTYAMVNDLRDQVNQSMYQPQVEETIDVEVDGEVYEMSLSLAEDIISESEEIADFLESLEGEMTEEQSQQLDELSKGKLAAYIKKASISMHNNSTNAERAYARADNAAKFNDGAGYERHTARMLKAFDGVKKRHKGISRAADKLAEDEQIDELSKKTLGSYIKKASTHVANTARKAGQADAESQEIGRLTGSDSRTWKHREAIEKSKGVDYDSRAKLDRHIDKRSRGIRRAADKLAK
jgi:hypothetical protein